MCPFQEYIEIEGAGILLSPEFGLVLFHLDHVWYEGEKVLQLENGSTNHLIFWINNLFDLSVPLFHSSPPPGVWWGGSASTSTWIKAQVL